MEAAPIVCAQCGRKYAWKSELAGRKVRCACGAVMVAPAQVARDARAEEEVEELAEPVARPAGRKYVAATGSAAEGAEGGRAVELGYQTPAGGDEGEPLRPARDLHIPLALLVCGFVGIMLWAYVSEGGKVAAVFYSLLAAVTTAVKAGVIIGLALMIARSNDVSFGPVRRAVLKFAGIIAFADATAFWFDWILEQIGLLPHGYTTIYAIALAIIITGVMIGFLCRMLFDMDHQETLLVGMLLGLLSWGLGFAMHWGVALGLEAALAPAPPPAPPGGSTPGVVAPAPATPVPPAAPMNAVDQIVEQRLAMKVMVREAREYNERSVLPQQARYVELFYSAGATGVWFDLEGGSRARPGKMYVKLPAAPEAREACFKLYVDTCSDWRVEPEAEFSTETQQRYLVMPMPK